MKYYIIKKILLINLFSKFLANFIFYVRYLKYIQLFI